MSDDRLRRSRALSITALLLGGALACSNNVAKREVTPGSGGAGGSPSVATDAGSGGGEPGDAAEPEPPPIADSAVEIADSSAGVADSSTVDAVDQPVACPAGALTPGVHDRKLMHGGLARSFRVYVPRRYDNTKAVPLVLSFHGMGSINTTQETLTQMDAKADSAGFIVVYPLGTGSYDTNDLYSWNAGACCGNAVVNQVDDVGFARAIVADVRAAACIDPRRVFATGFSNGGRLSYRLGCEAADLFAAIAAVAGIKSFPDLMNTPGCRPSRPISLLDIMGTADTTHIGYQPGQIKEWTALDGCTDAAPVQTYSQNGHVCHTYQHCQAGTTVTACTVSGAPHTWPIVGGFNSTDQVWDLFSRSSL